MTKEEFIGKLQMCYFGDRNAFNEIVGEYDRLKAEYERIYNENCKLREQHNINDISLLDENNRLNNIINKLEKDLNEAYDELHRGELVNGRELINNIYQELKELKDSD